MAGVQATPVAIRVASAAEAQMHSENGAALQKPTCHGHDMRSFGRVQECAVLKRLGAPCVSLSRVQMAGKSQGRFVRSRALHTLHDPRPHQQVKSSHSDLATGSIDKIRGCRSWVRAQCSCTRFGLNFSTCVTWLPGSDLIKNKWLRTREPQRMTNRFLGENTTNTQP